LDFSCGESFHSWFIGRLATGGATTNLKSLFDAETISKLTNQESGAFSYFANGQRRVLQADLPALQPQSLGDDEILDLAAISRARA
jgi:hypothetical protein